LIPENDADKALLYSWRFKQAEMCGSRYVDGELVNISIWFYEEQRVNRLKTPAKKA
jgi:dolichyl-phosphate-mannose--protein O-mannosyl transferase